MLLIKVLSKKVHHTAEVSPISMMADIILEIFHTEKPKVKEFMCILMDQFTRDSSVIQGLMVKEPLFMLIKD